VKDPRWTWYATGPGVGIQTSKGRLVIPCDHTEAKTKANRSHVIYSDDNARRGTKGGVLVEKTNECQVVERSDGVLLLNVRKLSRQEPQGRRHQQGWRPDVVPT